MITPGDVDDRKPLEYNNFVESLVAGGYINKNLFQRLFVDGIQLITKLKSNMKEALMSESDKLLHRKRAIIETVTHNLLCFEFVEVTLNKMQKYTLSTKQPPPFTLSTFILAILWLYRYLSHEAI